MCSGTQAGGRITARTLPANRAPKRILELNGFQLVGIVYDDEDGKVLEWIFKKAVPHNRK
ncbi:hypothetical protein GCM10027443_01390 [Pontibacter brevis]